MQYQDWIKKVVHLVKYKVRYQNLLNGINTSKQV